MTISSSGKFLLSISADGYDTSGTGPVSQSETETSTQDITDSPLNASQFVPKTEGRGMFVEAKGQEVNKVIYGDIEAGSVRGVPGQVRFSVIISDKKMHVLFLCPFFFISKYVQIHLIFPNYRLVFLFRHISCNYKRMIEFVLQIVQYRKKS